MTWGTDAGVCWFAAVFPPRCVAREIAGPGRRRVTAGDVVPRRRQCVVPATSQPKLVFPSSTTIPSSSRAGPQVSPIALLFFLHRIYAGYRFGFDALLLMRILVFLKGTLLVQFMMRSLCFVTK